MKQQGDTIQRIKQFTSSTVNNLKLELIEYCKEKQAIICTNKFVECINSFEALIFCLINEIGDQRTFVNHKVVSIEGLMEALKGQNQDLQEKLAGAQLLIQQKNLQIQILNNVNATLTQNILALETQIPNLLNSSEEQSQDSLQDINTDDLELYESDYQQLESEEDQVSDFGSLL